LPGDAAASPPRRCAGVVAAAGLAAVAAAGELTAAGTETSVRAARGGRGEGTESGFAEEDAVSFAGAPPADDASPDFLGLRFLAPGPWAPPVTLGGRTILPNSSFVSTSLDGYSSRLILPSAPCCGSYRPAKMSASASCTARSYRWARSVGSAAKVDRSAVRVALTAVTLSCACGTLACCSSVLSELPTQAGGLPEGAPERPATALAYPAVHDMPPPRNSGAVLTEEEKKKVEAQLEAIRAEQARRAAERSVIE